MFFWPGLAGLSKNALPIYLVYFLIPYYLGQFNNNYIIFKFFEIFKNYFFQIKKCFVKDNSEYLGIFHLLK
jgi:hypothetical protein